MMIKTKCDHALAEALGSILALFFLIKGKEDTIATVRQLIDEIEADKDIT